MKINIKRGWYQAFPALVFNVTDGGFKSALKKTEKILLIYICFFHFIRIIRENNKLMVKEL